MPSKKHLEMPSLLLIYRIICSELLLGLTTNLTIGRAYNYPMYNKEKVLNYTLR